MSREIEKIRDDLAYSAAKSEIESLCTPCMGEGCLCWYDTKEVDPELESFVARSVLYLSAMNLLIRYPKNPALVRVKDHQ